MSGHSKWVDVKAKHGSEANTPVDLTDFHNFKVKTQGYLRVITGPGLVLELSPVNRMSPERAEQIAAALEKVWQEGKAWGMHTGSMDASKTSFLKGAQDGRVLGFDEGVDSRLWRNRVHPLLRKIAFWL